MSPRIWAEPEGPLGRYVSMESERAIEAYRAQPALVEEQANQEMDTAQGGYAHRQLVELVQNGADQLAKSGGGKIQILLSERHLYCADNGAPLDQEGARSLLFSHLSPKRNTNEIGRFGVGFKAVLKVSNSPAVFSQSGSIQFDRTRARQRILRGDDAGSARACPVLRVADAVDPYEAAERDQELNSLMRWAVNIVRLPLLPGAADDLQRQADSFRAGLLLFTPHLHELTLVQPESSKGYSVRSMSARRSGKLIELSDNDNDNDVVSEWRVFERMHSLSQSARDDRRELDDSDRIKISWAAPLSLGPTDEHNQRFWAFFPTQVNSLVGGILNAPWKTNEDRQSLLPGEYNNELLDAAAELVADHLTELSDTESPARHLDYLPRREDGGDNDYAKRIRAALNERLEDAAIAPDQQGRLRPLRMINVPPEQLTQRQQVNIEAVNLWTSYPYRPVAWLHTDALNNNRLSALQRVGGGGRSPRGSLDRATVAEWLEALTELGDRRGDAVEASARALRIAATLRSANRANRWQWNPRAAGDIVLTVSGEWVPPDPDRVFLYAEPVSDPDAMVHRELMRDAKALQAMKSLGLHAPSAESAFRASAQRVLDDWDSYRDIDDHQAWTQFWQLSRKVDDSAFFEELPSADVTHRYLRAHGLDGRWKPIQQLLLPGVIVPPDGSRDAPHTLDIEFHHSDLARLQKLGVSDRPQAGNWGTISTQHDAISDYVRGCQDHYYALDLPRRPRGWVAPFCKEDTSVPLAPFPYLSEDGQARYTEELLDLPSTYTPWTMWHDTSDKIYPKIEMESLPVYLLKRFGRVETASGMYPLSDGLGERPKRPEVRRWLLQRRRTAQIRQAFGLTNAAAGPIEAIGADDPIPLLDVWAGLRRRLTEEQQQLQLTRCDHIAQQDGGEIADEIVIRADTCYLVRGEERDELKCVARELELQLSDWVLDRILSRRVSDDVREHRERVRSKGSDAERLLAAVGEDDLRARLPTMLSEILSSESEPFTGVRVAEAAIATFHTGALREYKGHLGKLDPPRRWAGSGKALEFVRELGFGDEWAGRPKPKRPPYVDAVGPRSLPPLHDYQRRAAEQVKQILRASQGRMEGENRGLLSLPTGAGKTRVAVQAVIEAIRDEDFPGWVLWVADRDELCEQAVEAWQQAWVSLGPPAQELRISRMWGNQRPPETTSSASNVIVATIQTLRSRMARSRNNRVNGLPDYLRGIKLLVVDEAHGSLAPSFTQLMSELDLSFRRRADEIALLGLTATPYRGRNEEATRLLVNRYGANRLDTGLFPDLAIPDAPEQTNDPTQVIAELQRMNVLARADHGIIEGGTVELSSDERRKMEQTPWLPEEVERRIALDLDRTQRIIAEYRERVHNVQPDWPTLIFATSVEHAKTVAAMLELEGVSARAVSGDTDPGVRRAVVEDFRAGKLRVLVNYGVFREGFDAPKTRAIIVARPVYSPNLYFQMIGRGLRGTLNGGSERCLILDVADNVINFENQLAFTELEELWE